MVMVAYLFGFASGDLFACLLLPVEFGFVCWLLIGVDAWLPLGLPICASFGLLVCGLFGLFVYTA